MKRKYRKKDTYSIIEEDNISRRQIEEMWQLTPAYDLTYSNSIGGEHATCVNGNGKNPGMEDLIAVGRAAGLPVTKIKRIVKEIEEIVFTELSDVMKRYKA